MNAASQGDKALSTSDTLSAIQHFTQALVELPRAPTYYIKRSTAYSRVKAADGGPKSTASLRDAETALTLARERGKRELILSAQMRRGVALYQLERFGDAGFVFEIIQEKTSGGGAAEGKGKEEEVRDAMGAGGAAKKNGYEQELPIWVAKVKGRLNKLGEGDEKGVVSVKEYPSDVRVPTEKELKAQLEALKSGKTEAEENVSGAGQKSEDAAKTDKNGAASAPSTATPSATPVPEKIRHEWYQSNDSVVVTLYVKGIAKDSVATDLKDGSVSRFHFSVGIQMSQLLTTTATVVPPIPPPLRHRLRLHPRPILRNDRPLHLQGLRDVHQDRNNPAQANPRPEMERSRSIRDKRQARRSPSRYRLKANDRQGPLLPNLISPWR